MEPAAGWFSDMDRRLATNLRYRREALGMSQDELARRMTERGFGFSQATVWKIEREKRAVRFSEACALADALGLASLALLGVDPSALREAAEMHRVSAAFAAIREAERRNQWAKAELAACVPQPIGGWPDGHDMAKKRGERGPWGWWLVDLSPQPGEPIDVD